MLSTTITGDPGCNIQAKSETLRPVAKMSSITVKMIILVMPESTTVNHPIFTSASYRIIVAFDSAELFLAYGVIRSCLLCLVRTGFTHMSEGSGSWFT